MPTHITMTDRIIFLTDYIIMEVSIETDSIIMGIDVLDMDIIIIVDIDTIMADGIEHVMDIMDTTQVESTTIVHTITKIDIA